MTLRGELTTQTPVVVVNDDDDNQNGTPDNEDPDGDGPAGYVAVDVVRVTVAGIQSVELSRHDPGDGETNFWPSGDANANPADMGGGATWFKVRKETVVHESGHQFDQVDFVKGHRDHRNWLDTDGCIMLYDSIKSNDLTNEIAHFGGSGKEPGQC